MASIEHHMRPVEGDVVERLFWVILHGSAFDIPLMLSLR